MRHIHLLALASSMMTLTVFASSEVCIDHAKNEIQINAHYIFYGSEARTETARPCIDEINRMVNIGAQIQLNKKGLWRTLVAKVTHSILPESDVAGFALSNTNPKYNIVRLDNPTDKSRVDVSEHSLNGNSGYFIVANKLGASTTCTHEFGHGLGLNHPVPCDFRGKGVPPVMANRGCYVDQQFQYDTTVRAGLKGGTINPNSRKLHYKEIQALNFGDLDFKWVSQDKECALQGHAQNRIYHRDGTSYTRSQLKSMESWSEQGLRFLKTHLNK